jgi:hypothetical protein
MSTALGASAREAQPFTDRTAVTGCQQLSKLQPSSRTTIQALEVVYPFGILGVRRTPGRAT